MTTGRKVLRMNRSERGVSTDWNRLQRFIAADEAELLRGLLDTTTWEDQVSGAYPNVLVSGGIAEEHTTVEAPLRAEVIQGLLVRPQGGTFNLFVDPGVVLEIAPDGAPDESAYKYVRDPGVLVAGNFVLVANAAGSPRVDVIECRPVEVIEETDNRDVEVDQNTGEWDTPAVTKVSRLGLEFRARQGTPGSGYPGNASGWLPLAVAVHAAGSTSNDNVEFWDVRPLLADRRRLFDHRQTDVSGAAIETRFFTSYTGADAGKFVAQGCAYGAIGSRIAGGFFNTQQPTDLFAASTARDPGSVFNVPKTPWYLYMCFPHGLPRWVRYQAAPLARLPNGPRGVPITSTVACNATALNSADVTIPSGVFGAATAVTPGNAVSVTAGRCQDTTQPNAVYASGGWVYHFGGSGVSTLYQTPTAYATASATWDLYDGVLWPANALELDVAFRLNWAAAATAAGGMISPAVSISSPNDLANIDLVLWESSFAIPPQTNPYTLEAWVRCKIPLGNLTNFLPGTTNVLRRRIRLSVVGMVTPSGLPAFDGVSNTAKLFLHGWRLRS